MIAAITNTISVPIGTVKVPKSIAAPIKRRQQDPERDPEGGAQQRGDDALVADHPPDLTAAHADRAQHAELAGALEDRQHERVDDPEQADHDRKRQQHVEEVEQRGQPLELVVDELRLVLELGVREAGQGRVQPVGVGRRDAAPHVDEREQVLGVLILAVEQGLRDRDVTVGRRALGWTGDADQRQMQELAGGGLERQTASRRADDGRLA